MHSIWLTDPIRTGRYAGGGESRVAATMGPLSAPGSLAFELLLE